MAILTVEYTSKPISVAVKNAAAKNPTLRCGLSSFEFDAARGVKVAAQLLAACFYRFRCSAFAPISAR